MHSFVFKLHPRNLCEKGPSESGGNGNIDKSINKSFDSFIDEIFGKLKNGEDAKETIRKYGSQLSQGTKDTLQFFIDSGQFDLSNKLSWSALKSFATRSMNGDFTRGYRLDAMKDCLRKSQISNTQHILVLSNGYWDSLDKKTYVQNVSTDISHLNANVLQDSIKSGQFKTFFGNETQGDIALYLQGRNYKSRLIGKDGDIKSIMEPLAKKKKEEEIKKIDPMISQIQKEFSGSPEVMKGVQILSKNIGVTLDASGKIDMDIILQDFFREQKEGRSEQAIMNHLKITLDGIENKMKIIREEILSERTNILTKIGGDKSNPSNFPELIQLNLNVKDSDGKTVDLRNTPFKSLSKNQAKTVLAQISQLDQSKMGSKLAQLIIFLGLQVKLGDAEGIIADSTQAKKSIKKGEISIKKGENGKVEILESEKSKERRNIAKKSAEQKRNLQDTQEILKNENITSLSSAQDELSHIIFEGAKGELSQEKKVRKALLEQYIRINGDIAMSYKNAIKTLGEEEAREVFTDSYRAVSNNPGETYDFKALEKIAILTDPESTPGERAFARLEPGQSISIEKFMQGEVMQNSLAFAPEIANMNISMNQDGTFEIPLFRENNLTEPQVKEYMINIGLYANLGLSQFIPHIPLITEELRSKGMDIKMNGTTNTKEQQTVLKYLYTQLFTEKLETDSLPEVQSAFHSQMNLAPNMKIAMQETLEDNGLINSPGQPIAADTIKTWLRGTPSGSHLHIDPLANMV